MRGNTYVTIKVAEKDAGSAKELLIGVEAGQSSGLNWTSEIDEADGVIVLEFDELNCGGGPEADLLEKADFPFFLEHGPPDEFGEGQEVFDGEKRQWAPTWGSDIVVRFDPQLRGINDDELAAAREFSELRDRTFAAMWRRSGRTGEQPKTAGPSTTPDLFQAWEKGN